MADSTFSCCAYCWRKEPSWDGLLYFKCDGCSKRVHYGCIKRLQPSPLQDDTFFHFKCESCSEDGKEDFTRMKLSWQDVVALSVYHLQKTSQGKCGFFHWRGHICAFIDHHWRCLFGLYRKKTTLWMGTVAGTLSAGCPALFTSGSNVVEMGYWKLTELKVPLPYAEKKKPPAKKKVVPEAPTYLNPEERRSRRPKDNALTAAMELKEKRLPSTSSSSRKKSTAKTSSTTEISESTTEARKPKRQTKVGKKSKPSEREDDPAGDINAVAASDAEDTSSLSSSLVSYGHEAEHTDSLGGSRLDFLKAIKVEAEDDTDDLDIDIGSMSALDDMLDFRPESPDVNSVLHCVTDPSEGYSNSDVVPGKSPVKHHQAAEGIIVKQEVDVEPAETTLDLDRGTEREESDVPGEEEEEEGESTDSGEEEADDDDEDGSDDDDEDKSEDGETGERVPRLDAGPKKRGPGRPRKRRRSDDAPPPSPPQRLKRISVFEERELLQRLNEASKLQPLRPDLAQLRRKLICNQTNREFSLPVFDLDSQLEKLTRLENGSENMDRFQGEAFFPKMPTPSTHGKETRDLDRFMMHESAAKAKSRTYTSFHQRLVGCEDHELKPFVSPYTTRVLLPFIWRNYNPSKKPLKLKLLQELQAYPHRNDPSWEAAPSPPIDFCYVRPEHIPSVNALCREFFWPGIDMSECLQYPDFSCVVLYRKIVIGFAFMVPDRGYNEAYISFVFTHPEWRGAGIATFMVYHLIQTCMGKDVLLHVSATNPAMLLYQRFGFKAQELIRNFYYKYFPFDCKDSTHAFLMRLTR